jgi:16S rRNA (guanine(966)-N(2))-methyltransferase RsmD
VPVVPGLRPTPDRVRETLFNWLGQDLDGARCLDLFAGSGILGFEALSRGAALCVAFERDRLACARLREAAARLGAEGYELRSGNSRALLAAERRAFDVIFVDPPFDEEWLPGLWPELARCLAQDGRLYVEAPQRVAPPAGWELLRGDKAGQVHYHLLRRNAAATESDPTPLPAARGRPC